VHIEPWLGLRLSLRITGEKTTARLAVTYDDFQHYGIDRHSIRPALCELEALGFIEVTDSGRAGNAEFRRPAKYRLTYKDANREFPTHDWKRIETKEQAEHLAKRARANRSGTPRRGKARCLPHGFRSGARSPPGSLTD
jgi:hypothetical protein